MGKNRFGALFKRLRIAGGKTLRSFCVEHGFDPGNISKLERGLLPAPQSQENLAEYAATLGLEEGSEEWQHFLDVAAAEGGRIPEDLLSDSELVDKLPVLFRTLRGQRADGESLDDLAEKIRRS